MVFKIYKNKKSTAELIHCDLFGVYNFSFAQLPISQDKINVFWSDLITMVPEWNSFIFMQTDYPRCPPGAVTLESKKINMTISQEPLVKLIQLCARIVYE